MEKSHLLPQEIVISYENSLMVPPHLTSPACIDRGRGNFPLPTTGGDEAHHHNKGLPRKAGLRGEADWRTSTTDCFSCLSGEWQTRPAPKLSKLQHSKLKHAVVRTE